MPTTEISIERLWPIAGKRAPRIVDQILTALSWVPFLVVLGIQMSIRGTAPEVALSIIASLAVLPVPRTPPDGSGLILSSVSAQATGRKLGWVGGCR
jgi:hypothetical protein